MITDVTAPRSEPKHPPTRAELDFAEGRIRFRAKNVANQCGLAGTILLPRHEQVLRELAAALPHGAGGVTPLNGVTESTLPAVRELLAKLPQTPPIRAYLAQTVKGPLVRTNE